jgi:regulator of replication initiation timing
MKIEIEKSEYDRLKSREEKLMAYYEWFVDKENDLVTVEDIVNKNIELEEENKKLREELSAYDREYFDEDKKAKNIFKEDDTYVYDAKQVRDIC